METFEVVVTTKMQVWAVDAAEACRFATRVTETGMDRVDFNETDKANIGVHGHTGINWERTHVSAAIKE